MIFAMLFAMLFVAVVNCKCMYYDIRYVIRRSG